MMLPIQQLTSPVTDVVVPALSRLQDDPERFRGYYRKAIQALSSLTMPVVIFTFVVADELVLLVLGPQWDGTAVLFRLLMPAAFVGTFNGAAGWVWVALNRTDRQLRWGLIATPFYIAAFGIGVVWGPKGVAIAFMCDAMPVALRRARLLLPDELPRLPRPVVCHLASERGFHRRGRVASRGSCIGARATPGCVGEPGHQCDGLLHRLSDGVAVHAGWARSAGEHARLVA